MPHYLFSYGTLQKEKVQLESFGRLLTGTKDILRGYRLNMIEITDPSVLSKSEQQFHPMAVLTDHRSDCIEGMVFEISNEELAAADRYEVDDYQRVHVLLDSGKEAWVYVQK